MSSSTRVKPREGFALLLALAFVAIMSMSLGALMTVISIPNKTFTTNSSRLLSTHEARMSAELLLKNIADNELVFQSLNLIQSSNASSALAEWNNHCSSLTSAELRDVMNEGEPCRCLCHQPVRSFGRHGFRFRAANVLFGPGQ